MTEEHKLILGTLREQYGRICWTHKTHEKERESATDDVKATKWVNIALTFITLAGLIATAKFPDGEILYWLTVFFALVAFSSQVFNLSFNPGKTENDHRQAAKSLLRMRESYLILITRTMAGDEIENLKIDSEKISEQLTELFSHLPDTGPKAYSSATTALKSNEELTFSDGEVDKLLPKSLRMLMN